MHRSFGISRRQFIRRTSALAVAAPTIISATALGNDKAEPPSQRLNIGFVGMGKQSRWHTGYLSGKTDVQVLAVCDVDTTRREDAKAGIEKKYEKLERKGYKGCDAYVDYHELLARKDIDAVLIATPDHWHAAVAIEACKAGKDVYSEKPLTLTIHEAKTLIDCVRKYDRVFQTGSQQRSSKEFRTAVEYVRSGRIGKVKQVLVDVGGPSKPCDLPEEMMEPGLDWDRWLGQAPKRPYNSILSPRGIHNNFPAWRSYREYSGGGMTDWGAHHFDIAQWGLDMDHSGPVEIIPPEDPKAQKGVKYIYANGVEMIHGGGGGVTFIGTEGQIFVNRGKISSTPDSILKEPLTDKDVKVYDSKDHHEDWLKCIKTRQRPICDVEIGARSVTVCHLGNLAYWNHRTLKWDPQKWEFPGDAEANGWRDRARRAGYELPAI
jgi:predicted dehydrogenase